MHLVSPGHGARHYTCDKLVSRVVSERELEPCPYVCGGAVRNKHPTHGVDHNGKLGVHDKLTKTRFRVVGIVILARMALHVPADALLVGQRRRRYLSEDGLVAIRV